MLCGSLKFRKVRRVVCCDQGAVPATAWRALQLERINRGVACPLAGIWNSGRSRG